MPDAADHGALMKRALQEIKSLKAELAEARAAQREPIAIVGMACRFPGGVTTPDAYWELLNSGTDAITEVPRVRWDIDSVYDADPDAPGKMYTRHGGFLDAIEQFDAQFFGVSPLDAANMDPQQRILLEVAWEALEHAGQVPGEIAKTGVYVGSFMDDYLQLNFEAADRRAIDAYNTLGLLRGLTAGRLAYALDLHGPAMQLDTACSSSLLAAHLACQALRSRECDLALAGGVNLTLMPEVTIGLCRMKAMAVDGRCKTFDARADGYVRGEGCGIVVLRRLSDAIAAGDAIYAVIRGSAVNHDGRSNGLTAPNGSAQKIVIRDALQDAGVDPRAIQFVEAHGTGTSLGDPIEAIALGEVLCQDRPDDERLLVGSVKSNFGHLESAAGVAALMKVALSLQHGAIPPSLHFNEPNPHIPWERLPIAVPTAPTPWRAGAKRVAGISAFGMSGTNVHMIVEEAPPGLPRISEGAHVLTLSAPNAAALDALAQKYAVWLEGADEGALRDICRTSNQGRRHFEHRRAVAGDSVKQLAAQLRAPALPRSERRRRPRVAFLFPGEGAPLGLDAPAFRAALDECTAILPRFRDSAQTSLFAHQYALARLWMSWGIAPDAVLGDGAGEFAAACIAGDCTLEEGLTAARERRPAPDPQRFADSLRKLRDLDQRIVIDLDSSDGATFVDDLTVLDGARPMETLAVLYEHGFNPDWIAVDGKASKLALPTYPFQREPFWIRHKPQPRSRFHFELSPGDDASLRDHRLNGRVLVPGAAYAVLALEHAHATALRDVRFTRPLSFADGDDPTLHLVLTPRGDFQFADQSLAEYCHGTIDTSRAESTRVSLEELQARHGEECAPEGADAGFAIGPAYQWTRSVRHGAHEVLCELRPATQLTAGLLDACLRTLALCRPDRAAREIEVPVCIGSLRVFGAPRDTTLWCHAEVAGDGGNVRLFDDAGNVLLEVLGLETRRVPIATLIGATTLDDALVKIEWMRVEGQRVDPAANDVVFECAGHDIGPRLLALLKTIDESATLWLVTRNTQAVLPNDPIEPAHAWIWGLGRVLALEHPRLRCIRVDLDDAGAPVAIAGEPELAIRDGVAYAPRLVPAQMPRETLRLRADATYVITGAFGALGSRVARWMVGQGARNLVLVGRNPSPVTLDANVRIVRGDVADPEVVARIGTVDGVIHAAGVLDDGLLQDLTWDRFERVFATKVRGTRNLDAHTRAMKLDFFVCFSSAASLIGSAGQANYAAANAAMDALIHQRRSLGLPGLSINWGAWAGGGMADTMDARLRALGLAPIDPAAGLELLGRLIASDAAQVGVIPKTAPLVADAMPEQVDTPMLLLQRTPPHERQRGLELHIRERVISVMGRDPFPASDNDISFFEIGMDSLMSLDLRNRLQTDLDQPLPSTIAFEYPTIPNLAEHLLADILLFDAAR